MRREKPKKWPKRIPTWRQIWERATRGMPEWTLKYGGKPRPRYYEALGGPLDGQLLVLVDGTTAPLRIGSQRGQYRCALVAGKTYRSYGTTKWIPSMGDV